jgi:hypothetical protein
VKSSLVCTAIAVALLVETRGADACDDVCFSAELAFASTARRKLDDWVSEVRRRCHQPLPRTAKGAPATCAIEREGRDGPWTLSVYAGNEAVPAWWYSLDVGPDTIKVRTMPTTIATLRDMWRLVQHTMFDVAYRVGLAPDVRGGGCVRIDAESAFRDDPRALLNFTTLFGNLGISPLRDGHPALSTSPAEQRNAYERLDPALYPRSRDGIRRLTADLSALLGAQADISVTTPPTVEVRAFASQRSAIDLVAHLHLLDATLEYARWLAQRGESVRYDNRFIRLPATGGRELDAPDATHVVQAFHRLVRRLQQLRYLPRDRDDLYGDPFTVYERYMPPQLVERLRQLRGE